MLFTVPKYLLEPLLNRNAFRKIAWLVNILATERDVMIGQ